MLELVQIRNAGIGDAHVAIEVDLRFWLEPRVDLGRRGFDKPLSLRLGK
jgi:hypothetical protein